MPLQGMKPVTVKAIVLCGVFLITGTYGGYVISQIGEEESNIVRPNRKTHENEWRKEKKTTLKTDRKVLTDRDIKNLKVRLQKGMTIGEIYLELENLYENLPGNLFAINFLTTVCAEMDPAASIIALMNRNHEYHWQTEYVRAQILNKWSNADPAAAVRFYRENKDKIPDYGIEDEMVKNLAKQSPGEAWNWLKELDSKGNAWQVQAFFGELVLSHPGEVEKYINKMDFSVSNVISPLEDILHKWAKADYASAEKWVKKLPDDIKNNFERALIGPLALHDRERLREEYEKMENGDDRCDAIGAISESMLREYTFPETADFLLTLGEQDEVSDMGLHAYYHSWFQTDPIEFKNWVEKQPEGQGRDKAIEAYSGKSFFSNYEQEIALVNSISDKKMRSESMNRFLRNWLREDPVKMKTWVEQSDLSGMEKQRWLEEKKK